MSFAEGLSFLHKELQEEKNVRYWLLNLMMQYLAKTNVGLSLLMVSDQPSGYQTIGAGERLFRVADKKFVLAYEKGV